MTWQTQPIHVLDFEGSVRYGIIEYGAVTVHRGEITRCQTALCQAEGEIEEREAWLHGLRREDTEGHPPFSTHWDTFNDLRQSGPLAAHHASVEHGLLKRNWPYPSTAPDFSADGLRIADWGPWLDTRALYGRLYPALPSHKLGNLVAAFNLQSGLGALARDHCPANRSQYHCALYDALAAALLLLRLAQMPETANLSMEQFYALSSGTAQDGQGELF